MYKIKTNNLFDHQATGLLANLSQIYVPSTHIHTNFYII